MGTSLRIGFMQGRLSPQVDGKIQAFPWSYWRDEFPQAQVLGLGLMEWTLDQDRLYENPLLTREGRSEIRRLSQEFGVQVASLTGDCFMQAPFWKATGSEQASLKRDFDAVTEACSEAGITWVVVPLVDHGRLENPDQGRILVDFLLSRQEFLRAHGVKVVFESDFPPAQFAEFISALPDDLFGINYDIGNSAALGFNVEEEVRTFGNRILNVHIKDRIRGGTTVPLATGAADLPLAFRLLKEIGYRGNFILQTARAADGNHAQALARYKNMSEQWWGLP